MKRGTKKTKGAGGLSPNGVGVYDARMRNFAAIFVIGLMAVGLGGCGDYARYMPNVPFLPTTAAEPLQIASVEKKGTVVRPNVSNAVFYADGDYVLHVIAESEGADPGTGMPVRQVLIMRIFWVPVGGKTSLNPTSVNFTFRYLLIAPESAAQYEGAGFVRAYGKADAKEMPLRIMNSDLRMTEKTGKFTDVLSRCRVTGNFTARRDDNEAVARIAKAQQEFFAASLEIAEASTRPAAVETMPAATETAPATSTAPGAQP
jgi:hypothetical protein